MKKEKKSEEFKIQTPLRHLPRDRTSHLPSFLLPPFPLIFTSNFFRLTRVTRIASNVQSVKIMKRDVCLKCGYRKIKKGDEPHSNSADYVDSKSLTHFSDYWSFIAYWAQDVRALYSGDYADYLDSSFKLWENSCSPKDLR